VVTERLAGGGSRVLTAYPAVDLSWEATVYNTPDPAAQLFSTVINLWVLWQAKKAGFPEMPLTAETRMRLEATLSRDLQHFARTVTPGEIRDSPTLQTIASRELAEKRRRSLEKIQGAFAQQPSLPLARQKQLVAKALGDLKPKIGLKPQQMAELFQAWMEGKQLSPPIVEKISARTSSRRSSNQLIETLDTIDRLTMIHALLAFTLGRAVDGSWGKPLR
jgi:hypothetical protein